MQKKVFFLFRIGVTLGLIFILFKFIPYRQLRRIFQDSNKIYLIFGFFIFYAGYVVAILRWRFILAALGVKLGVFEAFLTFFSGLFFNLFFPSFVAGDVFRGGMISYRYGDLKKVMSSVFMDRFSGGVALILVSLLASAAGGSKFYHPQIFNALLLCTAIVILAFSVVFSRTVFSFLTRILPDSLSVKRKMINFHDQLGFFKRNKLVFLKSLAFSAAIHVVTCTTFYVNSLAFGVDMRFFNFLIVVPLVMVVAILPITIAGAGTREAAAIYFFSLIGIDKSVALSISLLNLAVIIFSGFLGGILYVTVYHRWVARRV